MDAPGREPDSSRALRGGMVSCSDAESGVAAASERSTWFTTSECSENLVVNSRARLIERFVAVHVALVEQLRQHEAVRSDGGAQVGGHAGDAVVGVLVRQLVQQWQ